MNAQPEPVDYLALHTCSACGKKLRLRTFPVRDGWLVGTGCDCREKSGGPLRYSTEVERAFPTFDAAERGIHDFLHPRSTNPTFAAHLEAA